MVPRSFRSLRSRPVIRSPLSPKKTSTPKAPYVAGGREVIRVLVQKEEGHGVMPEDREDGNGSPTVERGNSAHSKEEWQIGGKASISEGNRRSPC